MKQPSNTSTATETGAVQCSQCGAIAPVGESCAERFDALLALDHSRQEPWGSRHGPAFAVYTLQHSAGVKADVLNTAWLMLSRIYEHGDAPQDVANGMRATYRSRDNATYSKENRKSHTAWSASILPARQSPPKRFAMTIVDLGDFDATTYAAQLDAWCRATMNAWSTIDE